MDRKIIEYLPPVMRDYEEIQQICNAEQSVKEKMWDNLYKLFRERHISTQTEKTAALWEKTLKITADASESIEVRNIRIIGRSQEGLYTAKSFERLLLSLVGDKNYFSLDVQPEKYTVIIYIRSNDSHFISAISDVVDNIIPAHLMLYINHMYNTHEVLARYPHYILQQFTHEELMTEVIDYHLSDKVETISEQDVGFIERVTVGNIEKYGFRKRVNE